MAPPLMGETRLFGSDTYVWNGPEGGWQYVAPQNLSTGSSEAPALPVMSTAPATAPAPAPAPAFQIDPSLTSSTPPLGVTHPHLLPPAPSNIGGFGNIPISPGEPVEDPFQNPSNFAGSPIGKLWGVLSNPSGAKKDELEAARRLQYPQLFDTPPSAAVLKLMNDLGGDKASNPVIPVNTQDPSMANLGQGTTPPTPPIPPSPPSGTGLDTGGQKGQTGGYVPGTLSGGQDLPELPAMTRPIRPGSGIHFGPYKPPVVSPSPGPGQAPTLEPGLYEDPFSTPQPGTIPSPITISPPPSIVPQGPGQAPTSEPGLVHTVPVTPSPSPSTSPFNDPYGPNIPIQPQPVPVQGPEPVMGPEPASLGPAWQRSWSPADQYRNWVSSQYNQGGLGSQLMAEPTLARGYGSAMGRYLLGIGAGRIAGEDPLNPSLTRGQQFANYLTGGQRASLDDVRQSYRDLASSLTGWGTGDDALSSLNPLYTHFGDPTKAGYRSNILDATQAALGRGSMGADTLGSVYDLMARQYGPDAGARFSQWTSSAFGGPSGKTFQTSQPQMGPPLPNVPDPLQLMPGIPAG